MYTSPYAPGPRATFSSKRLSNNAARPYTNIAPASIAASLRVNLLSCTSAFHPGMKSAPPLRAVALLPSKRTPPINPPSLSKIPPPASAVLFMKSHAADERKGPFRARRARRSVERDPRDRTSTPSGG
eukprot:31045-Pelagococcus_subviridis.AAC.5